MHGANGCVSCFGGIKDPGFLGVMRGMDCVPSVQRVSVMECVPGTSSMECMPKCKSAGRAPTQTGYDGKSDLRAFLVQFECMAQGHKVHLVTALRGAVWTCGSFS